MGQINTKQSNCSRTASGSGNSNHRSKVEDNFHMQSTDSSGDVTSCSGTRCQLGRRKLANGNIKKAKIS